MEPGSIAGYTIALFFALNSLLCWANRRRRATPSNYRRRLIAELQEQQRISHG